MNTPDRAARPPSPSDRAGAQEARASGTGVRRATGRSREEWFASLDAWSARDRGYREIADWLTGEHGLTAWWAQKLIVEYQQARGLRPPGVRPDGTFTVTASKAVAVSADRLFDAFADAGLRARWLPGTALHERTSQPGRSARFDFADGATRVNVLITSDGKAKSTAAVEHEHLPDAETAKQTKAFWRERLAALKDLLEA